MALKPDRVESFTDVSFFMNTTGDRGGVVVYSGAGGVGSSMDDADAVVIYPTGSPAGTAPAGVLLNDVVNLDLTRQHINWHKDEVQQGGKVTLLQVGQVTTDSVTGAIAAGEPAFVGASGLFTATAPTDVDSELAQARVGTFLSSRDSDGYVKVAVNFA